MSNTLYGIELYAKNSNIWTKQLQKAQNRLLKILLSKSRIYSTNKLHKDLNILKVNDLAKLRTLLICHRTIHHKNKTNKIHKDLTLSEYTGRNMRNNLNFKTETKFYLTKNKVIEKAAIL